MTAYYNEIDPYAAQWLRNLIAAGHIAPGEVDERSIKDVQPDDLEGFTQCHFFAGIGVWSYALRGAGWSDDRPVWTGSCPCQPFSAAGKGEGLDDPRHLWPDWFRLIRERRPLVVFGEQVAGADGIAWLDLAQADLEEHSHTVGAVVTCSAGFGGPDIRQRLYWVAYPERGAPERHGLALAGEARRGEGEGDQRQRLRDESRHGRDVSRMADTGHAERRPRHSARDTGGQHVLRQEREEGAVEPRERVPDGRLADAHGERREGLGLQLLAGEPRSTIPEASRRGEAGGVGDARGSGLPERERRARVLGAASSGDAREAVERGSLRSGGLADTDGGIEGDRGIQRSGQHGLLQEDRRAVDGDLGPGPLNGFWRAADWLFCTDGKWRPVEPGTFPLDTGIANRLGRLRAYGNAINAEAAREFIGAYMDVV